MISAGEKNNKNVKIVSESDMVLIGQIFNNPSLMNLLRSFCGNPKMLEYLNNLPEIKRLKEKNPIFNEILNNPELMDKLFTPDLFNTFSQMVNMIDKDKNNKNKEIKNNNSFDQLLGENTNMANKNMYNK